MTSDTLTLRMGVIEARNLAAADKTGFSDPYAVIRINSKKYTTKVVKQTLDPVWNFEFDINMHPGRLPALINITVWDKDTFGRDFLGEVTVPFKNVFDRNAGGSADGVARHYGDSENQSAWYTLNKRTEKNNVSGEISLRFGFMEKVIRPCEEYMAAWDQLIV
ncbi:C2 domain-containing protein [Halteromyces radiatus]|uniref:C2 domain-containing protein n=1 Tax=Halteromyces radiatus TaxID=101107 RepID=UPI002220B65E|nr:C2 domain-containing protein [Halteromyces radiatus]KAI8099528.1 C2 domain-containing protein [Halteromyces radiatus]